MSSEKPEEIGMSRDFLKQFPIEKDKGRSKRERERERVNNHYFDLSKENGLQRGNEFCIVSNV